MPRLTWQRSEGWGQQRLQMSGMWTSNELLGLTLLAGSTGGIIDPAVALAHVDGVIFEDLAYHHLDQVDRHRLELKITYRT